MALATVLHCRLWTNPVQAAMQSINARELQRSCRAPTPLPLKAALCQAEMAIFMIVRLRKVDAVFSRSEIPTESLRLMRVRLRRDLRAIASLGVRGAREDA